ncbi:universal stress protein [Actinomycetospora termitidis]|uniref:Universal stress protein n=1 Tax=Actinomycetospora termitidis TaxID=3053470 RepID=A0ABT7MET9_9PSEU|nr:universal stress protein [Actinomycetospora sp. Odt1-22]MDL5158502.1 universal stress protein [Actinomycetospora sp. Odt1-22]
MGEFEYGTDGPKLILAAVDGSTTSLHAGAYAVGLARRQHSELVVITVTTTPALSGLSADAVTVLAESAQSLASDLHEQAKEYLRLLKMEARLMTVHGDPYIEIVRAADDLRADAVVVGASMKAGHRLVGSLAGRLIKAGKWPVTVVP